MKWLNDNWRKIGVSILFFVILFFVVEWRGSLSKTALIEKDLPTIKSSELPSTLNDANAEKYNFIHGYIGVKGKYTEVNVDGDPIEAPITLKYSNIRRSLKLKSDVEIDALILSRAKENKFINDVLEIQRWRDEVREQLNQYGEIARQYLPSDIIASYYEIDLDNDGVKEKLITICGSSSNHCSDYAEIIKSNEVVFSTQFYANSRGISLATDGFYVNWTNEDSFLEDKVEAGLCCEFSHNRTQFTFQNGKYVSIKQWKIPHVWKRVLE